jgi:DNA-binding NtrC family response regulator
MPTPVICDAKITPVLAKYTWPGNVRELKSVVFRAAKLCQKSTIHIGDLSVPVRMCYMKDKNSVLGYSDEIDLRWWSLKEFIKNKEIEYVNQVLKATKGDKSKAAKLMGISVADFYNKYGNPK